MIGDNDWQIHDTDAKGIGMMEIEVLNRIRRAGLVGWLVRQLRAPILRKSLSKRWRGRGLVFNISSWVFLELRIFFPFQQR